MPQADPQNALKCALQKGDRLRCAGTLIGNSVKGGSAWVHFDGDPTDAASLIDPGVLALAERLPRKLAVGDRILRNGSDVGTLKLLGRKYPDAPDAVVEWSDGTLGVYVLSDLRLADPRTENWT